jgi:alpha-L-fucosidase
MKRSSRLLVAYGVVLCAGIDARAESVSPIATASSEAGKAYEAGKAVDGDEKTRWACGERTGWLELDLGKEMRIGTAFVMELKKPGYPHILDFAIEHKEGEKWKTVYQGGDISGARVYDFKPVTARYFRLTLRKVLKGTTSIQEFHVYAPGSRLPEVAELARKKDTENALRRQWFDEAKYGLFINWGLYSVLAGEWKGKPIGGLGEWIMHNARIPVKEYELLAPQFNPVKFNAEEWVQLAVDAGMKYLVFDCKQHDGFAMYHSEVSKYNCFDATPWKRDPFKELQQACDRHGLKLCFYYSQATDWHEPNGANNDWDFPPNPQKDFNQYFRDKSMPQVKELLTHYGPIGLIWFDVPTLMTPEYSKQLAELVHSLQPATLINSRLGPGGLQDYHSRGDNEIPHDFSPGAWETAATINRTWGFKKDDHSWKTPENITFKLVDVVSKGGNYLLNVGPDGDGFIPQPSQDILRKVGAWLKVNGEAIYGAGRTPFGEELGSLDPVRKDKAGFPVFNAKTAWRCTAKPGKLYIHLFQWPGAKFELADVKGQVAKAYFLSNRNIPVSFTQEGGKVVFQFPEKAPDSIVAVLCLDVPR